MTRVMRAIWPVLGLCLLLVVIQTIASGQSLVLQRDIVQMLINVVLVVGLYVFAGNSGVLSFGQMSFMAIGAYATAIFTIPAVQKAFLLPDLPGFLGDLHLDTLPAAIAAGLVAAAIGAVIAVPIVRLAGLTASLAMFAVLVVVHEVASNWDAVTRGSRTMLGVPTNTTGWSALAWAIVVIVIAYVYQRSNAGLRLRAAREDEFAARAVGVSVPRERWIAFVLSAFIVGVGGFLYAQYQGAFNPNEFYTEITFLTIAMLVVGGMKSLSGAVVGAVTVTLLSQLFDSWEDGVSVGPVDFAGREGLSALLLAAFFLGVLIWRRQGLTGGRELRWERPAWTRRLGDVRRTRRGTTAED
jgi:branched-chain amino acid transport system permease protein